MVPLTPVVLFVPDGVPPDVDPVTSAVAAVPPDPDVPYGPRGLR